MSKCVIFCELIMCFAVKQIKRDKKVQYCLLTYNGGKL